MRRRKTDYVVFTLRLREALRRKLEGAARRREQSLNSELIDRIEWSFNAQDTEALLGLFVDRPADAMRLLNGMAIALRRSRGWMTDPVKRRALQEATWLLIEACAVGEVPAETQPWEVAEIAAGEESREVKADGRLLASLAFEPHEKIFKPVEDEEAQ